MEPLPEIRGGDAQDLLDFFRTQAVQLAEEEGVGESLRELGEAPAEDVPELAGLHLPAGVAAPVRRADPPVAPAIEGRSPVPLADPPLPAAGSRDPAEVVHDLVPEDPDQPCPLARTARERSPARRASRNVSWTTSAARSGDRSRNSAYR